MKMNVLGAAAAIAAALAISAASCASAETMVYASEGAEVFVEMIDVDSMIMSADGRTYKLRRARSASGALYECAGDPSTFFWGKGEEATVAIRGRDLPGDLTLVQSVPDGEDHEITIGDEIFTMRRVAARRGVRYVSDEPGTEYRATRSGGELTIRGRVESRWQLSRDANDDRPDSVSLEYKGRTYELTRDEKTGRYSTLNDATTYFFGEKDNGELFVAGRRVIAYAPARASRIGSIDGRFLPVDRMMRVTSITGISDADISDINITFERDGSLHGRAAVNSFVGRWISARSSIIVDSLGSTKMMGPPELMTVEDAFISALDKVREFAIKRSVISLFTSDGRMITAIIEE